MGHKPMSPTPALLLLAALFSTGCRQVTLNDQAVLRRPALDFQGKGVRALEGTLSGQIETGRSSTVNAAAGSCSACQ